MPHATPSTHPDDKFCKRIICPTPYSNHWQIADKWGCHQPGRGEDDFGDYTLVCADVVDPELPPNSSPPEPQVPRTLKTTKTYSIMLTNTRIPGDNHETPSPLHYSTNTKYTNGWQEAPLSDAPIQRPIFRPASAAVGEYTAKLACQ